jgi:hypothetical protein
MATKEYSVKPTARQREAYKILSENIGSVYKKEALIKAGYSEQIARSPALVTEAKGFQILMEEAGLTDKFLNNALFDDIQAKPANRKAELELAYKLKGRLKDEDTSSKQTLNVTNILNFIDNSGSNLPEGLGEDYLEGETL